ncbi:MAG: GNAT family N-acetyltransferase [Rubripirellula sp.]|nr:GNAT family N-acetyltransferase [Rubripirellula sp.]
MIFETARLLVRNLVDADFDAFHEMQSDIEVMRYTTGSGFDEAENRQQLSDCIRHYAEPGNDFWVWAVVRKTDQQFVGTCAIVPNGENAEIGYRFLRKFFGNGYGRETCNGLIEHGIHVQKLREIIAYADIENIASIKILDQSVLSFVEETKTEEGGVDWLYRWLAEPKLYKVPAGAAHE